MYLEHFGLQRPPFRITPDPSMFYSGNKRGAVLEALKYAIISGEGMIKVVGEVGSGKTMLCRMLELELSDEVEIVYIANPSLSPDNILHVIAFELNLAVTAESSKLEVMQAVQAYLLERHAQNHKIVVFVEEAQSMPVETLEEIRLLSNLETSDEKLLQMVLFGQPELDEKLRQPSIRQLKERITHNFYLDPFPAADVYRYLNFRLRAVGYMGPDLFTPRMASNIERKSCGLTRRINILADKVLLAAFSDGGHTINQKHLTLAARDSDFGAVFNWKPYLTAVAILAAIILSLWIGTQLNLPASVEQDRVAPARPATQATDPAVSASAAIATPVNSLNQLLEQRLTVTRDWLDQAEGDNYTLQLILIDTRSNAEILSLIDRIQHPLDIEKVYIYQASIGGRMVFSVLYNEYTVFKEASKQLDALPQWLLKSGPYLRTIKGIKADIRKTHHAISLQGGENN